MISKYRSARRITLTAFASGLVIAASGVSLSLADDQPHQCSANCPLHSKAAAKKAAGNAPPVVVPPQPAPVQGEQGFGLSFHLGYGYGGDMIGVGREGGYPFYGGPGYPHPAPVLRRIGWETPFSYFGGDRHPSQCNLNYYSQTGPLSFDPPVVTFEDDPKDPPYTNSYGSFTGAIAYPESTFAPYVTMASTRGSTSGVISPISAPPPPNEPSASAAGGSVGLTLGIQFETVADGDTQLGLKVTSVAPKSLAEKAGLGVGDVILAINGYVTQKPSDLSWIMENATKDKFLNITLKNASDAKTKTLDVKLP